MLNDRELPDLVRQRARERVLTSLRAERSPFRTKSFVPIAAAASGFVVVGSAIVAAAVFAGGARTVTPAAPVVALNEQNWVFTPEQHYRVKHDWATPDDLDRCRSAGREFPASWQWKPVMTATARGATVIPFRSAEGVAFCELTPATISLSPILTDGPGGDPARILFTTAAGSVAGVVRPDSPSVRLTRLGRDKPEAADVAVHDGIFVAPNAFSLVGARAGLKVGGSARHEGADYQLPPELVPSPTPAVTDRPQPPGDRTTPDGVRLGECLAGQVSPPTVDEASWQPGAYLRLNARETVQLGRYGDMIASCMTDGTKRTLLVDDHNPLYAHDQPTMRTITFKERFYDFRGSAQGGSSSSTVVVVGRVLDEAARSVSLVRPNQPEVRAVMANGSYIVPGVELTQWPASKDLPTRLVVRDADGAVLEDVRVRI
ncbi:hypothetical protein [Allokutzneria oryzae]|uniref:Uncharacterized protein n=1 Tax=Allokutzneria oryzae TaxID=1378989 RepID=A0ABV6AAL5_9PSEU